MKIFPPILLSDLALSFMACLMCGTVKIIATMTIKNLPSLKTALTEPGVNA